MAGIIFCWTCWAKGTEGEEAGKTQASGSQRDGHKHQAEEQPDVVTFGSGLRGVRGDGEPSLEGWGGFEDKDITPGLEQASVPSASTGLMADPNFWPLGKQGAPSLVTSPELLSAQPYLSRVAALAASDPGWQPLGLRGSTSWRTCNAFAYLEPSLGELWQADREALALSWGMETSSKNIAKGAC